MHIKARYLELGVVTGFREVLGKGVKVEPQLLALFLPRHKLSNNVKMLF